MDSDATATVRADVPGVEARARDYGHRPGGAVAVSPVGEQDIMGGTMTTVAIRWINVIRSTGIQPCERVSVLVGKSCLDEATRRADEHNPHGGPRTGAQSAGSSEARGPV